MSWRDYNEVIAEAREVFGLDLGEARDWYREMREEFERPVTVTDMYNYPETSLEVAEQYFPETLAPDWVIEEGFTDEWEEYVEQYGEEPPPEYFSYDLEEVWEYGDDDWIDPEDEVEVTIDLEYEEGK